MAGEDKVKAKITIGSYFWSEESDYPSINWDTKNELETELPGSFTEAQITQYILENAQQNGETLVDAMKGFAIPFTDLRVSSFRQNATESVRRISSMRLKACFDAENSERPEGRKRDYLGLEFLAYDKTMRIAGEKRRADKLAIRIGKIDIALQLSTNIKSEDDLVEVLLFKYITDCPFHYGNFSEREYIEANQKVWKDKLSQIDENVVVWVESDTANLRILQRLFTEWDSTKKLLQNRRFGNSPLSSIVTAGYKKFGNDDPEGQAKLEALKKQFPYKLHYEYLTADHWIRLYSKIIANLPRTGYCGFDYLTRAVVLELIDKLQDKSILDSLPREFLDSTMYLQNPKPLPNILPDTEAIAKMSADEIEATITKYVGMKIEDLHKNLYPNGYSDSGFIQEGERIGEVIKKDAELLLRLGIDRDKLADRMEAAILISRRALYERHGEQAKVEANKKRAEEILGAYDCNGFPWAIGHISWMGVQNDPFHPSFDNPSCSATTDYFVDYKKSKEEQEKEKEKEAKEEQEKEKEENAESEESEDESEDSEDRSDLQFGTLLPQFIRRLCFFETTGYRVDPEKAFEMFFHPQVDEVIAKHKQGI